MQDRFTSGWGRLLYGRQRMRQTQHFSAMTSIICSYVVPEHIDSNVQKALFFTDIERALFLYMWIFFFFLRHSILWFWQAGAGDETSLSFKNWPCRNPSIPHLFLLAILKFLPHILLTIICVSVNLKFILGTSAFWKLQSGLRRQDVT